MAISQTSLWILGYCSQYGKVSFKIIYSIYEKILFIYRFDGQFVLQWILDDNNYSKPELIMDGNKIMFLMADNVKLMDSYNYVAAPLSSFSKSFNIPTIVKGYIFQNLNISINSKSLELFHSNSSSQRIMIMLDQFQQKTCTTMIPRLRNNSKSLICSTTS